MAKKSRFKVRRAFQPWARAHAPHDAVLELDPGEDWVKLALRMGQLEPTSDKPRGEIVELPPRRMTTKDPLPGEEAAEAAETGRGEQAPPEDPRAASASEEPGEAVEEPEDEGRAMDAAQELVELTLPELKSEAAEATLEVLEFAVELERSRQNPRSGAVEILNGEIHNRRAAVTAEGAGD